MAIFFGQDPDDGKVSGDTTEIYHHDFKRLDNGHYMVLGERYSWRIVPDTFDITKFRAENLQTSEGVTRVKILFGTIIEYDKRGNVVWWWDSADYLSDKDLFSDQVSTNTFRMTLPAKAEIFGHLNAFEVDADGQYVYAGFRDLNRIIKIEKSTGNVVYSWGKKMPSGEAMVGDDLFISQHELMLSPDGNKILVFNNNDINNTVNSSEVIEFSQPKGESPTKITWLFDCRFDALGNGKSIRGGGVQYMDGDNVLICMAGGGRVTEVNKKTNEVVWDCIFSKEMDTKQTVPITLYRTHYNTSLYPCYFTAQSPLDVVDAKTSSINLTIYNEGTNEDSYTITVSTDTVTKISHEQSEVVAPAESQTISISIDKRTLSKTGLTITVFSNTNNDLKKKVVLPFAE